MIENILSEPDTASCTGQVCLRCWASNNKGYQLVYTGIENSLADALQSALDKWKEISPRFNLLIYKISTSQEIISSGKIDRHNHYKNILP